MPNHIAIHSRPRLRTHLQIAALAVALVATTFVAAAPVRAAGGDALRHAANAYRVDRGLAPVVGTALLDDIAKHRAAQLAAADRMEHDLGYVSRRLNQSGVCWSGYGEILAWESGWYSDYSAERMMEMWWESPTHHAIMMGEGYNAAGGAWDAAKDGGHYAVMVFVTLCTQPAASRADTLSADDRYNPDRELVIKPGRERGYRLSTNGNVLRTDTVRFRSTARASSGGRAEVNGTAWLKVTSGRLAGFWVRESPSSFVRGTTDRRAFGQNYRIQIEKGRYVGRTYDWLGRVMEARTYTFGQARAPRVSARAIINGRRCYRLDSTDLAGLWIVDTASVHPR